MSENCFTLVNDFSDVLGSQKVISASIGPEGEACLLLVAEEDVAIACARKLSQGGGNFALSRATRPYPATFIRYSGEKLQETHIPSVKQAFPDAQPLPNGHILLAGGRCDFRNGNPEKNAVVLDRHGRLVRRFVLGDGIQDFQTTRNGLIWVSYFDEGVMGNRGWEEPIGFAGLACFDVMGRKVWDFEPPEGCGTIVDCYALNAADDSVWLCYYTEFPVVRVDPKNKTRAWANNFRGAQAMAVDDRRVVLWGGYGEEHSRCVIQEFGRDKLENAHLISLRLPEVIEKGNFRAIGRGDVLHLFFGPRWYSWKLR